MNQIPTMLVTMKGEKGSDPRLINVSDFDKTLHTEKKASKPSAKAKEQESNEEGGSEEPSASSDTKEI